MLDARNPRQLRHIYDNAAWRYDWQHAVLTAFSDQRGRQHLVREAVRRGDRILDAGGGTGSTALLAAKAAGSGGQVTLVDVSVGMLRKASERAQAHGLSERILCTNSDIHHLPFPEESFDVVLSTYSLCPVQRPDRAALALFRLVKPGGRLGVAHSAEPRAPWLRGLARTVDRWAALWPALSLGCRSIEVENELVNAGAVKQFDEMLGVPLWPFRVMVFVKPTADFSQSAISGLN